ncbi:hypothetical protein IJ750_01005 [bacterium]|nr:hypothetical protein [bacterium]
MKIPAFFKLLNKKIEKYDKAVSNPFETVNVPITIIWVEEDKSKNLRD